MNKKHRELVERLPLMNYTGKIKTNENETFGMYVLKTVVKEANDDVVAIPIYFQIRSHQIKLPFNEETDIDRFLVESKNIAKEILDNEVEELIENYINISIKDMEINSLYDKWTILTKQNGDIYIDKEGNVILVKYYRLLPKSSFLAKYYGVDELQELSKEEGN